jgi:dynein heavy chain
MVAEANYGGRVTDDKDRRLICVILKKFYCPEALDDRYFRVISSYKYSPDGLYYAPKEGNLDDYKEFI